jgi:hypothetical protein
VKSILSFLPRIVLGIRVRMRLNYNLKIPARVPQKEPVPFQAVLPLRLKKTVSGKRDKTAGL